MVNSLNVYRCAARSARLAAALMLVAVSVAGCRQKEPDMPAVATPTVTFSRDRVALGSPVKVTYRFQVAANATFDRDYWVFVHVLNPQGEALWNISSCDSANHWS